jgi:hypothetical protein
MENYTKKAVTIQAVQWNGKNIKELAKFMATEEDGSWIQDLNLEDVNYPHTFLQGQHWIFDDTVLLIKTLEGNMIASDGDYIIRGVKGEYYPCKPDIFELTYNQEKLSKLQEFIISNLDAPIFNTDTFTHVFFEPKTAKFLFMDVHIPMDEIIFLIEKNLIEYVGIKEHQGEKMLSYARTNIII